jgi:hypothetical protein
VLAWDVVVPAPGFGLIADTDGDGRQEIVTEFDTYPGPYVLTIYENDGDDSYAESYAGVIPGETNLIQSGEVADDLDGDGRSEILIGGWFDTDDDGFTDQSRVIGFENTGDDTYEIAWNFDFDPEINVQFVMDAGDLDGDGRKELLAGGLQGGPLTSHLHVLEAVGDNALQIVATFTQQNTLEAQSSATVADVDGDGRREIVFATTWSVTIYENTGDDAWHQIWSKAGGGVGPVNYLGLGAGDHDGDGKDEIIFRQNGWYGDTGVWEIDPAYGADADGDGRVDVVDNCPSTTNPGQEDADGDAVGDACDNCMYGPNPEQGPAVFGQEILAASPEQFVWAEPADAVYVRGGLAQVDTYAFDWLEALSLAHGFTDASMPGGGSGFYYLVKPDCSVGSWQSSLGAEPGRDEVLP